MKLFHILNPEMLRPPPFHSIARHIRTYVKMSKPELDLDSRVRPIPTLKPRRLTVFSCETSADWRVRPRDICMSCFPIGTEFLHENKLML